jgi:CheY-specific phosphatase CheX
MLQRAAEQTLESLAFAFPVPPEEMPPTEGPRTVVGVEFDGPGRGHLFLSLADEMIAPLVGNMLGEFGEMPSPEQQRDGVKELLNVVCGNILPVLAGTKAVFSLHPPAICDGGLLPERVDGAGALANAMLSLDCGAAELRLFAPDGAQWLQLA